MFNRRHYAFVAETLRAVRKDTVEISRDAINKTIDRVAWSFADKFKEDNALFDEDRFFNATVDGVVKRPRTA